MIVGRGPVLLNHMNQRILASKKEIAHAVNLSTRTIDHLVTKSIIPSIKVGRRRLFDIREVIEALKNQKPVN